MALLRSRRKLFAMALTRIDRVRAVVPQSLRPRHLRIGGVNSSTTATNSSWPKKTGLSAPLGMVGMIWNCSAAAAVRWSALATPDSFRRSMVAGL
jgi:hypothetical protein